MREALDKLLQNPRIWRGNRAHNRVPGSHTIATGYPVLDQCLPGGGWPRSALSEIIVDRYGTGELKLILPALSDLSASHRIVWVAPPHIPYAPALISDGVDVNNMLVIRPREPAEVLWAGEQCLRSGVCAAVLMWVGAVNEKRLRRLQLAAEEGACWGVLFRPPAVLTQTTPAALRLQLSPTFIHVLKSRGGKPARIRADFL